jgi:hypothetical protein
LSFASLHYVPDCPFNDPNRRIGKGENSRESFSVVGDGFDSYRGVFALESSIE